MSQKCQKNYSSCNFLMERAVLRGNVSKVQNLASRCNGHNVNQPLDYGMTLLHLACSAQMARTLIQLGACVNARDISGAIPLHCAVRENLGLELIQELLMHGSEVNMMDENMKTPLHLAIKADCIKATITEMLISGADILISPDDDDWPISYSSPLELAAKEKYTFSLAKFLLKIYLMFAGKLALQKLSKSFEGFINYRMRKLSYFYHKCLDEIEEMKLEKLTNNHSLYDLLRGEGRISDSLKNDSVELKTIVLKYPIFKDIIRSQTLKGENLLKIFCEFRLLVRHGIILNYYCMCELGKYLPDHDLQNFIRAFNRSALNMI